MRAASFIIAAALSGALVCASCHAPNAPAAPSEKPAPPPAPTASTSSSRPSAEKIEGASTKKNKKTLPGSSTFERGRSTFRQASEAWVFVPTDGGYDVLDADGKKAFVVEHKGRSFRLVKVGEAAPTLVLNWQPLGIAIGRQELGAAFLNLRLTSKGWQVHRPGKVVVGTYHGPLLKLGDRAATARADADGVVHAKIGGKAEVTHTGPLAAREVVLTLLPDLNLVEAAMVALFFAEERWN